MPDQLGRQGWPGPAEHLVPRRLAHRDPQFRVRGQPGDRVGQRVTVTGGDQAPGHALVHQVKRAARGRGDHGQAAGGGLLNRLAERLERAAVHEDVQARVDPRQVKAVGRRKSSVATSTVEICWGNASERQGHLVQRTGSP